MLYAIEIGSPGQKTCLARMLGLMLATSIKPSVFLARLDVILSSVCFSGTHFYIWKVELISE
jgi:hypothetical protein